MHISVSFASYIFLGAVLNSKRRKRPQWLNFERFTVDHEPLCTFDIHWVLLICFYNYLTISLNAEEDHNIVT